MLRKVIDEAPQHDNTKALRGDIDEALGLGNVHAPPHANIEAINCAHCGRGKPLSHRKREGEAQ